MFIGGAAAAAVRYLFDPEQGDARRTRVREQVMSRLGEVGGRAKGSATSAAQQMKERATELKDAATAPTTGTAIERGRLQAPACSPRTAGAPGET